ncbi:hypothetical protein SAMN04487898_115142 [Pedobacter sp. ok626]|uniref:DUF6266 family protein n=1 Tax=Pedobacter sp. ok626 TaxID=1761882 RepID=UPI000890F4C8|nr:DUF6266 family protein [Pedobacter sp. ok626]SDL15659.1 hypothetical protein SAMN04487898_115142 [Pedobacter sp. ok626]
MARIRNGIFGPIHGKLGNLVGATWKNVPYLRVLPDLTKNSKLATQAQIASREKFKFMQEWLVPFYSYVTVGFKNHAKDKTEINAAFSINYKLAIVGVYPDLSIDYSKVVLSKGYLPGLFNAEVQFSANTEELELTWLQNYNDDSSLDDLLILTVYNRELKIVDGFIGGVRRADLKCSLKLNPKLIGRSLDVYVSLISLNGKKVANSEYLGRVVAI